ncbi:GspE/PulE family protein [Candidatus Cytomitobacter primus]|uniref:Type II/IV secretion system protein n=1 Tax=Candidatus Cytomitobacter primus TaxID=2066024 RepID=A0A5C0UGA4_9PROT|nr:GspE/PulE family protein [Candidatus Cytomitobacter primus]QEK38312.1 type II/IV secretion system protein [Candidatus Cytomitobacter primus]
MNYANSKEIQSVEDELDISNCFVEDSLLSAFPENFCIKKSILPLSFTNGILTIASSEDVFYISEDISSYVKFDRLIYKKVKKDLIISYIKKFYKKLNFQSSDFNSEISNIGEYICDKILLDSFTKKASDIHFCPGINSVSVKYRVDGVLRNVFEFEKEKWPPVSVRIKVISELDISETRIPQDGSFSKEISGKKIDFRVACHPTMHGENIVLRVLGNSKPIDLKELNYSQDTLENINKFIDMPDGLVIFTGPVGSGKTTSLYSILSHLDPHSNNIVTLEDPIESYIPLVRQTDVNKSPNMNFASGIKSLLRQDPNIMLIGEIRDSETAHMVMRAAMTGHKIFTTLHTNNVFGVFDRLIEFGIEKTLIMQYLKGVVSQRLIRKLCSCKELVPNNLPELAQNSIQSKFIFQEAGCNKCDHTGFDGRVVVAESAYIKNDACCGGTIYNQVDMKKLIPEDFKTMSMNAIERVISGDTTYNEIKKSFDIY